MGVELARRFWVQRALIGIGLVLLLAILHLRVPATFPVPWVSKLFSVQPATFIGWAVDVFGFAFTFVVGLILISQFALPVQIWDERMQAVSRIFDYAFGSVGPVVFVTNGKLIASRQELARGGAGVVLVDTTSAVVLERGAGYSRAEGPGIVFLRRGEHIYATLDLRKQARGQPAAGLTKDGIEVKTTVGVTFGLATPTHQPHEVVMEEADRFTGARQMLRQYPFDAKSAFKAIYGTAAGSDAPVVWTDLPVFIAAERFRALLARQTLDDLFRPLDQLTFPLQDFSKKLTEAVRQEPVLRERGIEVFSVSVGAFELPTEVMKQRIVSWESEWNKQAEVKLAAGETEGEKIKQRAQNEAQTEVMNVVRAALKGPGETWTPADKERTMRRIVGALRQLATPFNRRFHSSDALRILAMLDLPKEMLGPGIEPGALDDLMRLPGGSDEPGGEASGAPAARPRNDPFEDMP